MKQGTRTTINVNGNKLDVIFLGKGTWTNAYRDEGGRSAFLNVRRGRGRIFGGTVDYSKDILVNCNSIPHLPAVERLGGVDGNEWFLSPLYQPLKAANVKSWTQYRALEAAVKEVTDGYTHLPKSSPDRMYRQLMRVAGVLESKNFPAIAMAVETLAGYAADYETWGFEVAPRNLGVGVDGELILLDCLFVYGEW